jgi:selT/selW/selH-like putative selenoprotein
VPAGGGCFEVFVGKERIWSKLETGEFPEPEAMLEAVADRVGG